MTTGDLTLYYQSACLGICVSCIALQPQYSTQLSTRRMAIANGTCVSFCNQPLSHFGLPWVRPGTIAVNVIWMERGFNVSQSMVAYTHIFNCLRAIARYWSEIAIFSYPLHLTPPLGCSHWNSGKTFGPQKTRIMGLPDSEDILR